MKNLPITTTAVSVNGLRVARVQKYLGKLQALDPSKRHINKFTIILLRLLIALRLIAAVKRLKML